MKGKLHSARGNFFCDGDGVFSHIFDYISHCHIGSWKVAHVTELKV